MRYFNHKPLFKTTTSADSNVVISRADKQPIKWFTLIADDDCYININADATTTSDSIKVDGGESYTTPEHIRVMSIDVIRSGASNVTVRGSAWV